MLSIGTWVGISWDNTRYSCTRRRTDLLQQSQQCFVQIVKEVAFASPYLTEAIKFWDNSFHHSQDTFINSDIYNLTSFLRSCFSNALARQKTQDDSQSCMHACQRVSQADIRSNWRLVWMTVDVPETAHSFAYRSIACALWIGSRLTVPRDTSID